MWKKEFSSFYIPLSKCENARINEWGFISLGGALRDETPLIDSRIFALGKWNVKRGKFFFPKKKNFPLPKKKNFPLLKPYFKVRFEGVTN